MNMRSGRKNLKMQNFNENNTFVGFVFCFLMWGHDCTDKSLFVTVTLLHN